jgi:hypothetical protein
LAAAGAESQILLKLAESNPKTSALPCEQRAITSKPPLKSKWSAAFGSSLCRHPKAVFVVV